MQGAALVSMALQSSQAWVSHLHRTNTNWAPGQIYNWEEQQAPSGLEQQKETRVHVKLATSNSEVHRKTSTYPSYCYSDALGWV